MFAESPISPYPWVVFCLLNPLPQTLDWLRLAAFVNVDGKVLGRLFSAALPPSLSVSPFVWAHLGYFKACISCSTTTVPKSNDQKSDKAILKSVKAHSRCTKKTEHQGYTDLQETVDEWIATAADTAEPCRNVENVKKRNRPRACMFWLPRPQLQGIVKQMLDEAQEAVQAQDTRLQEYTCLEFVFSCFVKDFSQADEI